VFVLSRGSCERSHVFTRSMRGPRELLQASRHRRVRLIAALLASASLALVLADARPPALFAIAPPALVLADARAPALLALAPDALVLADTRPPALLCMRSFGAGAGRCSPPRTPCIRSFRAGAGRCSHPRTPCIGSFGAGAGRHCAASSSLRRLLPLRWPPPVSRACGCCCCRRALPRQAQHAACCPLPLLQCLPAHLPISLFSKQLCTCVFIRSARTCVCGGEGAERPHQPLSEETEGVLCMWSLRNVLDSP